MKTFKITIRETVSEIFNIESSSKEDAIKKIIEKYNNCEIVLEPGELISKELKIIEDDAENDWIEF